MKTFKKILYWALGILAALVIISYLLPGTYKVERSIHIKSGPDMPYMLVSNFNLWHLWSPWTKETDPTMVVTINGETGKKGSKWSWNGEKFKQGAMELTNLEYGKLIEYSLTFENDSEKSSGKYSFETKGDSCMVTWTNEGNLGYNPVIRYMGLLMNTLMGPDFEKGLKSLKKISEARSGWPKIEEVSWPAQVLMTIRDSAGPSSYAVKMDKAFTELMSFSAKEKLQVKGAPFAIYLKWDSVTMESVMDIGFPIEKAGKGGGRIQIQDYPGQKVVLAHYFGPYEKTAPVYYILDQYIKESGLQPAGGPWEIYVTNPVTEKDTARWETVIAFPVK